MTFEQAVEHLLELEGGYVDDPQDPGGATRFGISSRSHPNENIETLTRERAKDIYRLEYWNRLKLEMMPEWIRLPFFDCAVNQGPGFATITLQRSVNAKADGIIGFVTLAQLNLADKDKLRLEFLTRRMRAYTESKNWPRFGAGWAMRLLQVSLL